MCDFYSIIQKLKQAGYSISSGITQQSEEVVKKTYDIYFPRTLKTFYMCGIPYTLRCNYGFPNWIDFDESNIENIKRRIDAPLYNLKLDVKDGFWIDKWGTRPLEADIASEVFDELSSYAPKLIPIYSHRYVPIIEGVDDPPIISVVGSDVIYYGSTLSDYMDREFFGKKGAIIVKSITRIPFWSDIIDYHNDRIKNSN